MSVITKRADFDVTYVIAVCLQYVVIVASSILMSRNRRRRKKPCIRMRNVSGAYRFTGLNEHCSVTPINQPMKCSSALLPAGIFGQWDLYHSIPAVFTCR